MEGKGAGESDLHFQSSWTAGRQKQNLRRRAEARTGHIRQRKYHCVVGISIRFILLPGAQQHGKQKTGLLTGNRPRHRHPLLPRKPRSERRAPHHDFVWTEPLWGDRGSEATTSPITPHCTASQMSPLSIRAVFNQCSAPEVSPGKPINYFLTIKIQSG